MTDAALSTQITSNSVTISGIDASTPVSVSGNGSPQIRIGGGSWVTSGNITNGQTLRVRLTSSGSNSTTRTATVNVGGVTDDWSVTTESGGPTGCPNIGNVCSDGSIFAGDGNLYVTDTNQSTSKKWKTSYGTDDINPDSSTDGRINHDNRSGNISDFPAFELCEKLHVIAPAQAHGHDDWYLPAKDELDHLYDNRNAIGGFSLAERYWSSTEASTNSAWGRQFFDDNGWRTSSKTSSTYHIRCVRRN